MDQTLLLVLAAVAVIALGASTVLFTRHLRTSGRPPATWAGRSVYIGLAAVCIVVGLLLLNTR